MKNIQLMQGDCLNLMREIPDGSIDLILADPPYNIARKNNFHTLGRAGIDFGEWDKGFDQFSWLREIPRILKRNGSVVIFNDWKNIGEIAKHCEALGLTIKDMLRWEKSNPMPRNRDRRYITDFECAVWLTNKGAKWKFHRISEVYQRPVFKHSVVMGANKHHPTQKPVRLMEEIILIHSDGGDVVLDPFMGSGTTGVACVNTGRHFIGIELDETYFKIAEERINNTQTGEASPVLPETAHSKSWLDELLSDCQSEVV